MEEPAVEVQAEPKKRVVRRRTVKAEVPVEEAAQAVPVKRTRKTRKTVSDEAPAAEPAVESQAAPAGEEKPKRRTRTVRKAAQAVQQEAPQAPDAAAAASEEAAPKPAVRRTVRRKKADAESAQAAAQPDVQVVEEAAPEVAAKPAKPRRTRQKAAADAADAVEALQTAEAAEAGEAAQPAAPEAVEEAPAAAESAEPAEAAPARKSRWQKKGPRVGKKARAQAQTGDAGDMPVPEDAPAIDAGFCSAQLFDPKVLAQGKAAKKNELVKQSEKLHKVLADLGLGSRRDMEQLIVEGRITVNSAPAYLGQRVMPGDIVKLNGRVVKRMAQGKQLKTPRVLVYHKPAGQIVSMRDPQGRPSVFEHLPKISGARWIAVGRLDFNTEGLLLFTTSGELANRLMHPRYQIEREYAVRAAGEMTEEAKEQLTTGVELEDGPAHFSMLEEKGGDNLNRWYLVRISEGRNREVRRMFAAVGLTVSRLIRVRYGAVRLPADLARGATRELKPDWVQAWMAQLNAAAAPAGAKTQAKKRGAQHKGQGSHGGRRPERIPDPMLSTVNYIASGSLGAAQGAYGRALARSDAGLPAPFKKGGRFGKASGGKNRSRR